MLTEKTYDTGEIVINFGEGGEKEKPLVFLHGASLNWQSSNECLLALANNWHVYAPDLRGHGKTGRAKSGYAYDNFVSDTATFIEGQVNEPVVLVGISWGGAIALGAAARLPSVVRALILLEPSFCFVREAGLQAFPGIQEWFNWLGQTLTSSDSFEEVTARCKESYPNSDEAFAQMVYNLDPQFISTFDSQSLRDYRPEQLLPQLACPTLLVYGEPNLGSVINDDDVAIFKRYVPDGITFHVKDVGHPVIWGPPGQVVLEEVTQFLNSL